MGSSLDFTSSESFRKKLMARNLVAYSKSPYKPVPPLNYETKLTDSAVIDSPDSLIDVPTFANDLYPLNQYGTEGGYKELRDPNTLQNRKSNEGEYGFQDAHLLDEGLVNTKQWQRINPYADPQNIIDSAQAFSTLDALQINNGRGTNAQPYPSTFVASSYGPVNILLFADPVGSDGLLSQDSYIAKLGSKLLKKEFEERIGREIIQRTVARANVFNVRSGTDVLNMVTGIVPLIEPNYVITVPDNLVIAATDLALRLAGSYIPVSPIPGSYFDPSINPGQPTTIQQLNNAFKKSTVGKFVNRVLGATQTGSQLFLNNTGGGQKSRLFGNLNYNKYKPGYDRTLFDRVRGVLAGSTTNNSNYYVGSITSEPSRVFSPSGVLPVNSFGEEQQTPVYGPSELAALYEGQTAKEVKLGANGVAYVNGGGIEGGLTWISPGTESNAGKRVTVGGGTSSTEGIQVLPSFGSTISTTKEFKDGSILYDTQKIIDAAGKSGGKKLQHVGNAIDQVSKVFNDGYNEMTRGSKVLSYKFNSQTGIVEGGVEYCRVFSKDLPYLQYNDLQKTKGMTTEGRKFNWSVMDKTYNLNMYPVKQNGGQDSTNLIGNTNGYAKKYMFSLENLAWSTSNKPGFSYNELPICERGPNGGRVMWFPPYDLKFSESVGASWKATDFLGRPEPVYTYVNTNRTGSLSWKIVVDHPSVLNVLVNKVMNNSKTNDNVNAIIDSFFAGCMTYDLYELAKKYPTMSTNEIAYIQQQINEGKVTQEEFSVIVNQVTNGSDANPTGTIVTQSTQKIPTDTLKDFQNKGFYFENDYPKIGSVTNYTNQYNLYISHKPAYKTIASTSASTQIFFDNVVTPNYEKINSGLIDQIYTLLSDTKKTGTITIELVASASARAKIAYNQKLSERRKESVIKFFSESKVGQYMTSSPQRLIITAQAEGEQSSVETFNGTKFVPSSSQSCTDSDSLVTTNKEIYTTAAMACRSVRIKRILVDMNEPPPQQPSKPSEGTTTSKRLKAITKAVQPNASQIRQNRPGLSKRVLKSLLSECDYFEAIKEDTPMVYDNLRDKLKFFNPAFHSTTPEGLNSRLTFLQQCMRPGDTIPVLQKQDTRSTLSYNNAFNTSFGAPPVLIMRVGDFYNTKIIPDSLQIQFEGLDINPEGIGVQPMIANVTLGFKFVGGSGLKEAVDRLQNALSFNYYANTEMYDDRAFATDTGYTQYDVLFNDAPTENQVTNYDTQKNDNTIGDIITKETNNNIFTGTISYGKFMENLKSESQNYFQLIINKNKEIIEQYNNSVRQNLTITRNYKTGKLLNDTTSIYGKPVNYENKISGWFQALTDSINNETEPYIKSLIDCYLFSDKVIRTVKQNYISYLKDAQLEFSNGITAILQNLTIQQQSYVMWLSKANTIAFSGTSGEGGDGSQQVNGDVTVYYYSGYTEDKDNLINDLTKVKTNLNDFYNEITAAQDFQGPDMAYYSNVIFNEGIPINDIFSPISYNPKFVSNDFKLLYTILNQEVVNIVKYGIFKSRLIGNINNKKSLIGNGAGYDTLSTLTDLFWQTETRPAFEDENMLGLLFFQQLEKNQLKDFVKYTPYPNRTRVFDYTTDKLEADPVYDIRKNYIKYLGASTNDPKYSNKTWNDLDNGAYRPKVKFN